MNQPNRTSIPPLNPATRSVILAAVFTALLLTQLAVNAQSNTTTETIEATDAPPAMTLTQSAVLGVVEGVTEYLPVSSTGHLIVTQRLMGIGNDGSEEEKQAADAFAICIQAGAIVAVLGIYYRRVIQMINGVLGKDADGLRMAINILAGFIPAAIIGLTINDLIKEYLFGGDKWGLWPTVAAWLFGGIAILAVAFRRRKQDHDKNSGIELTQLTWKGALIIGFAQCIAMWPGVSRSLVTIVGGVLVGMRLSAAVEFSFLLGVVTLSAATAYDGLKHGEIMLATYGPATLAIGFITAAISAAAAVKWMVNYLNKHGLSIFGYYRIAIAIIVAALIVMKWV